VESALDARLLGLERRDDGAVLIALVPHLCRPDGALYGGTALAASLAAMELVTGRPSLWATAQLVASAQVGDELVCTVEVLAHGRYIDQVRVTGSVAEDIVFASVGSAAVTRPDGLRGVGVSMPAVTPPEDSAPRASRGSSWGDGEPGHHRVMEVLEAVPLDATQLERGRLTMWARIEDESTTTAAKLGFIADMVPLAACATAGVHGAGTSLDNSLRVGRLVDSEWVLLDLRGHVAEGGYGHGDAHLWSPDGVLLGTASQTAKLFTFDSFFGGPPR
jgi:acyl-CoA thioesterase